LALDFQGIPEVHQALQTNINGSTVGAVATTNFFKLGGFKFQSISKLRVKVGSASPNRGESKTSLKPLVTTFSNEFHYQGCRPSKITIK